MNGVLGQVIIGCLVKTLGEFVIATPKEWVDWILDHGKGVSPHYGENLNGVLFYLTVLYFEFRLQGVDA